MPIVNKPKTTTMKPAPRKLALTAADAKGKKPSPLPKFRYCYTTGPFLLPKNAGSLDWMLLNNDTTEQRARVTVFRCGIGQAKTPIMPPGAVDVTIAPGEVTHNANTYQAGEIFEIEVECNSQRVFPYVSVWVDNGAEVIPGTAIRAGEFVRMMP
jgi:hypothetical protein